MNKREFKKRLEQIKKIKFWASDINGGLYVIREFIENFTSFSKNIIKVSPNKNRTLYKYLVCDRQNLENLKNDSIFFRYPKGFKTDEYDSVLHLVYGDYMTPPPKADRVPTHGSTEIEIYE